MKFYKSFNDRGEVLDVHLSLKDAKRSVAASESRGYVYVYDISVNAKTVFSLLKDGDANINMGTLAWEAK